MIDLMKMAKHPSHHIRLTADFLDLICTGGHPSFLHGMGRLCHQGTLHMSHLMPQGRGAVEHSQILVSGFR